ncbi:MAG: hypothetical protein Q9209_003909 [Squamulea sp. 1 TL-2023]
MIEGLPPLPCVPGLVLYDPWDTHEAHLLDFFGLLEQVPLADLFFEHYIPHLENTEDPVVAEAKLRLIDFVLNKTLRPSDSFKARFANLELIPSSVRSSINGIQFRPLATTFDPTSAISDLFFDDEDVFPEPGFLKQHHEVLKTCGIVRKLTPEILIDRVHRFVTSRSKQRLIFKVKRLFSLPLDANFNLTAEFLTQFRTSRWIPISCSSPEGSQMVSPKDCRSADDKELVDLVLCVFEHPVTPRWKALLGWDQVLERETLLEQLNKSLVNQSSHRIDRVLAYIGSLGDCRFLMQYPCILTGHGEYVLPESVLLPGTLLSLYPLAPFLDQVDPSFARKHTQLLKVLGIRQEITVDDLLRVQSMVVTSAEAGKLSNDDLNVVISLLEISTRLQGDNKAPSLIMIPDTEGRLRPRTEIVCGERNVTGTIATFSFVNPRLSPDLVEQLGLENSFARATRLGIEIEDEDEDEYTPREKLTTIISDTLGRYTVDSTFSEFLANANDCGATHISWIIDACANGTYESSTLLSEELKGLQGSALFVYNNGGKSGNFVFDPDDETSTGMFGRGAMTMYHFTDVPMLISGSSFLILDPQQQLLPRNKHWKRKVGVKVPLKTARRLFPDQLRPFHGLEGYSMEDNSYDGTLYRLPFRVTEETLLKETSALAGVEETRALLEEYYSIAQMSLLFLRNVDTIDFRIRGQAASWSVMATRPDGTGEEIFQDTQITNNHQSGATYKTVWCTGMIDIEKAPGHLVNPGRRANKVTECGLAACLGCEGSFLKDLPNQVFCTLPTGHATRLPVSIHASFAITGDRKTIPFEDAKQNSAISAWNRWLLTSCIPELYLEFLRDLCPRLGEKAFEFWPTTAIATSNQSFSGVIRNAFWNRLAGEQYESYQIFPTVETQIATEQSTPLKTRTGGKKRRLFKVTSLKSAQFDVLPRRVSVNLTPLFSNICRNLVRPPRRLWQDMTEFKIHENSAVIGSQVVCNLFKVEANCVILEAFFKGLDAGSSRNEAMEMFLEIAIPDTSSDSHDRSELMNGCRIIPKLDHTLGTIKFQSGNDIAWSRDDLLFLPTLTEADLFAHSANSLIKPSLFRREAPKLETPLTALGIITHSPKNPLHDLVTEYSNIRTIGIWDIESFLVHINMSSAYTDTNETMDSWIVKFWSYLDPRLRTCLEERDAMTQGTSVSDLLKDLKLYDTPIYRYHESHSWHCITPQQFEGGPYIVRPFDQKEFDLCNLLPDLKIVDSSCLPRQLRDNELSLKSSQAFGRLLRALTATGASKIPQLYQESPGYERIQLLRDLVRAYTKTNDDTQYRKILRSLPIWLQHRPTLAATSVCCIPAEGAFMCAHGPMLLPWIPKRDTFVDPQMVSDYISTFQSLGCTIMTAESTWKHIEPSLPQTMSLDQLKSYLPCIDCLAKSNWKPQTDIAPNGYGVLCHPSSLFDHEDEIFLAAFGEFDKLRFLHPDFRSRREFWKGLGVRARSSSGAMTDLDFLQCIASIEARLKQTSNTDQNRRDAMKLTGYLSFVRPGFESWSNSSWATIMHARIYQTSTEVSSEPTYRQTKMLSLAQKTGPCSIQYATSRAHIRVLWSERPLLRDPPDAYVYKRVGPPLLDSVYKHLQHLISIRESIPGQELSQYLKDLQATYDFLQECPATASIIGIRDAKIWLNLPTTHLASISPSQLNGALRSAKSLCFNAPLDTHVVERAKNFLIPYESLLRKLGCQTMVRPSRPNLTPRSKDQRPIDQSLTVIRDMQEKGRLTDIDFKVDGLQISAHKIFMAAVSKYCQRQLLGKWGELLGSRSVIRIEEMTAKTLQHIVAFAYTGEVSWPVLDNAEDINEVADKLDELLDLLRGADMWLMESLHDLTERHLLDKSDTYVRPDNVDSVKELAEVARAKHLVRHCEEFIRVNAQFVQDCRDMK